MARTTALLVKGVLDGGGDYGANPGGVEPGLTSYIRTANLVTTRTAACAVRKGLDLSADELTEIETWLAAHLYKMSDQQRAGGGVAGASYSYRAQGGLNLDGTTYGQTAQLIDSSGCLAAIGKRQTAGAFWNGKPPSEQIDYLDRD